MTDPLTAFLDRVIFERANSLCWTLDYELIHQLILKALIEDSPEFLSRINSSMQGPPSCTIGPDGGLYDLEVATANCCAVFEIKVFQPLRADQIERQVAGLAGSNRQLFYLLLGRTGADWSRTRIDRDTHGARVKISYTELIAALDPI